MIPDHLGSLFDQGARVLVLSPHLDDAVLSCGALIRHLAGRCAVTVATVFTEAAAGPHTRAARSFLRQARAGDAHVLFAERRSEDSHVLRDLGVRRVHLGSTDALFRRRRRVERPGRLAAAVPELVHSYPTYRLDIARGRVARSDIPLVAEVAARVSDLRHRTGAEVVFGPLAVGRHVDHLIVRTVTQQLDTPLVYYSDFPYNLAASPDTCFTDRQRLVAWRWSEGVVAKEPLIRAYRTQADALFPGGAIPHVPELFYSR